VIKKFPKPTTPCIKIKLKMAVDLHDLAEQRNKEAK